MQYLLTNKHKEPVIYIKVLPLKGLTKPLWYQSTHLPITVGSVVIVPLQTQEIPAIVIEIAPAINLPYEVKSVISLEEFPNDQLFLDFIKQVAYYYQVAPLVLIKRFRKFIEQKHESSPEKILAEVSNQPITQLSIDQTQACAQIMPSIMNSSYQATILHGVTGSGKTEVYKSLIKNALELNKTVILLLPEVSLACQFETILKHSFDKYKVFGFHSASSAKQKRQLWQSLINNESCLIIGVHLPVLLPIHNLGLIIVDEEHETGYQEKKHPKLNSKELAIWRAKLYNIPIVLGSATPSISSLHNLNREDWQLVSMPKRFSGAFPNIKLVTIGKDQNQPHFLITRELASSIQDKLNKKQQIIIFLNRRGYSFFVQCQICKFIFYCPNCSVSLTLHKDESLRCHYCEYKTNMPSSCPKCPCKSFIKKGVGTQQIVAVLQKLFPCAKIERADLDTTSQKKSWHETVQKFTNREIDILVGTQTITKGYHFPGVTLVGILWADINLHMPVFNAAEVALQQILQVAGRAGRQSKSSEVIVQTMTNHPIFNYLQEDRYLEFYQTEITKRTITNYPPITRFVEIELTHVIEKLAEAEIHKLFQELEEKGLQISNTIEILGPVKPIVSKLKNWHTRKIYLKSPNITELLKLFNTIDQPNYKSKIFFTPNPLS